MQPKPKHLQPPYGAQFKDQSVVRAYQYRPPYPPAVIDQLASLSRDEPRRVLDAGCGAGRVARPLVEHVDALDAVDFSPGMIASGKELPNGRHPRLNWIEGPIEDAPLNPPYTLITAGQSLHWMAWQIVLPLFARILTANGVLAILDLFFSPASWQAELMELISRFSTNRDYQPTDMIAELGKRDLFRVRGRYASPPLTFDQPIDHYLESWHSRNGLSRQRMGRRAAEFDRQLRALVAPHCPDGFVHTEYSGHITWGDPLNPYA